MIAFLRGRVASVEPEAVILDVGGVGYRVNVTAGCAAGLRGRQEEIQLHTHMIVREDDIQLYGFVTPGEITAFLLLLSVNGVGPRAAMSVLSSLAPSGLGRALVMEDVQALTRVPGIGKKTAQRIILELKDKYGRLQHEPVTVEVKERGVVTTTVVPEDAIAALTALGYTLGEAGEAVRKILKKGEKVDDLQHLVKSALRLLDRKDK